MKQYIKSNETLYFFLRRLKMVFLRKKYGLKHVSKTFYMAGKNYLSKDFQAGDYSYIGTNCLIYPKVKIGRYTMFANNISILGSDHTYKDPNRPIIFSGREELRETIIGDDVWIGSNSIIMAGLTIGDGAIIGAGSVITKNVPPYSIYAGVPAKFIKMRFNEEEIAIHKNMLKNDSVKKDYCKDIS